MTLLCDRARCRRALDATLSAKWGLANPFVRWHQALPEQLQACLTRIDGESLRCVLTEMAADVANNGRGFPDLFVWRDADWRFIEVKSAHDQLRPQQLFWLDFLNRHGIRAELLKVRWADDIDAPHGESLSE